MCTAEELSQHHQGKKDHALIVTLAIISNFISKIKPRRYLLLFNKSNFFLSCDINLFTEHSTFFHSSFGQIRFIDNTDPAGIDHQIAQLGQELETTLVIVISKVRNTLSFTFLHVMCNVWGRN